MDVVEGMGEGGLDGESMSVSPDIAIQAALMSKLFFESSLGLESLKFLDTVRERLPKMSEIGSWVSKEQHDLKTYAEALSPHQDLGVLSLEKIGAPSSGTYLLRDEQGFPSKVIKPMDEGIFCPHNPSVAGFPSALKEVMDDFPFYEQPVNEVLAYEIAKTLAVTSLIPKTELAWIDSPDFYDLRNRFLKESSFITADLLGQREILQKIPEKIDPPLSKKLCSVREYVPHAVDFVTFSEEVSKIQFFLGGVSEFSPFFDPEEIDLAMIICWVIGNEDANLGNVLLYPKEISSSGARYGIRLIDLGLSFSKEREDFGLFFPFFFDLNRSLTERAQEIVKGIDLTKIEKILKEYRKEECFTALEERVFVLQGLIAEGHSVEKINEFFATWGEEEVEEDEGSLLWAKC